MKIQSHHPQIQASQIPLESLAGNPNISDDDKVAEVSRQFEAVLLRQILQQARKPGIGGSPDSPLGSDVYSDMVNQQLADSISRSGAFGLARSLQSELAHQVLKKDTLNSAADSKVHSAADSKADPTVGPTAHPAGKARKLSSPHDRKN
jgi:Rod binding domain-containing protein